MAEIPVRPRIRYPRDARVGLTYAMTVDLDHDVPPESWPYAEEEYPLTCFLDAGPLFDHEPVGDGTIVLHRFGGSYGPAVFRLRARRAARGTMRLSLVDRNGIPVSVISLDDVDVRDAPVAIGERIELPDVRVPSAARPAGFRWLHISDLHCDARSHRFRELNARVLDDVGALIRRDGPIDALFVTGDLSAHGAPDEIAQAAEVIGELERGLARLQHRTPNVFAVPGNHDLFMAPVRGYERWVRRWHGDAKLRERFFDREELELEFRTLVKTGFGPYMRWMGPRLDADGRTITGLVPGDFSVTLAVGQTIVAVVGLNDSFLHSFGGQHVGLDLGFEQLRDVGFGTRRSVARIQILLTHHAPAYLHPRARRLFETTIAPPGRFQIHLHGGMHGEPSPANVRSGSRGGSLAWQVRPYSESKERGTPGYAVGEVTAGPAHEVTIWPRLVGTAGSADPMVPLGADGGYRVTLARTDRKRPRRATAPEWYLERAVDRDARAQLVPGSMVYVWGPRRSGRTSLLRRLAAHLRRSYRVPVEIVTARDLVDRWAHAPTPGARVTGGALFIDDADDLIADGFGALLDLLGRRPEIPRAICLAGLHPVSSSDGGPISFPIEDFEPSELTGLWNRLGASAAAAATVEQIYALTRGEPHTTRFVFEALRRHPGDPSMSSGELVGQAIDAALAAGEAPPPIELDDVEALLLYRVVREGGVAERGFPGESALLDAGLARVVEVGGSSGLVVRSRLYERLYDETWLDDALAASTGAPAVRSGWTPRGWICIAGATPPLAPEVEQVARKLGERLVGAQLGIVVDGLRGVASSALVGFTTALAALELESHGRVRHETQERAARVAGVVVAIGGEVEPLADAAVLARRPLLVIPADAPSRRELVNLLDGWPRSVRWGGLTPDAVATLEDVDLDAATIVAEHVTALATRALHRRPTAELTISMAWLLGLDGDPGPVGSVAELVLEWRGGRAKGSLSLPVAGGSALPAEIVAELRTLLARNGPVSRPLVLRIERSLVETRWEVQIAAAVVPADSRLSIQRAGAAEVGWPRSGRGSVAVVEWPEAPAALERERLPARAFWPSTALEHDPRRLSPNPAVTFAHVNLVLDGIEPVARIGGRDLAGILRKRYPQLQGCLLEDESSSATDLLALASDVQAAGVPVVIVLPRLGIHERGLVCAQLALALGSGDPRRLVEAVDLTRAALGDTPALLVRAYEIVVIAPEP